MLNPVEKTQYQAPKWQKAADFEDILYHKAEGIARLSFNRPEVHNAFRPQTTDEMIRAFHDAWEDPEVGVIVITGEGGKAFCSGGDQRVRGEAGYVGSDGVPRLNVLTLQRMIRTCPKPVIASVAGWAIGGGVGTPLVHALLSCFPLANVLDQHREFVARRALACHPPISIDRARPSAHFADAPQAYRLQHDALEPPSRGRHPGKPHRHFLEYAKGSSTANPETVFFIAFQTVTMTPAFRPGNPQARRPTRTATPRATTAPPIQ